MRSIKVTTDVAERGISMLKTVVGSVKNENQFLCLIQTVERHRVQPPRVPKSRTQQSLGASLDSTAELFFGRLLVYEECLNRNMPKIMVAIY